MADEDGEEEFDKLDHIINSSGCAKELELSKGNFSAINRVRETTSDEPPFRPLDLANNSHFKKYI